jgi:hypothetical protein
MIFEAPAASVSVRRLWCRLMTVRATGLDYAAGIIRAVCRLAGAPSFVKDLQAEHPAAWYRRGSRAP